MYLKEASIGGKHTVTTYVDQESAVCRVRESVALAKRLKVLPHMISLWGFGQKTVETKGKVETAVNINDVCEQVQQLVVGDTAQHFDLLLTYITQEPFLAMMHFEKPNKIPGTRWEKQLLTDDTMPTWLL